MRGRLAAVVVVAAVLSAPAGAGAGGWATVTLSSTPEETPAGTPWVVDLEVLQHGTTPLAGIKPSITVTERRTGATRTVAARATGKTGVYRASVVFPKPGLYKYVVDDGFSQQHSYPAVRVPGGGAAATITSSSSDEFPWAAFAAVLIVGAAALGAAAVRAGRKPPRQQPSG